MFWLFVSFLLALTYRVVFILRIYFWNNKEYQHQLMFFKSVNIRNLLKFYLH